MAVKIIYTDITPGAAESATILSSGSAGDNPALLSTGAAIPKGISLEKNRWALDGTWELPSGTPPLCSSAVSGSNFALSPFPAVTVTFPEPIDITGLSFDFPGSDGEFAGEMELIWYRGSTVLASRTVHPDAVSYCVEQAVSGTDRIVIRITKTSCPNRRARLEKITFGLIRPFGPGELRRVTVRQTMDISGLSIDADNCDWTLDSDAEGLIFQSQQSIDLYEGYTRRGAFYIENGKRTAATLYGVETCDLKGILAAEDIGAMIWTGATSVATILSAVMGGHSYELHSSFASSTLSGFLPAGTRLDAVRHILVAMGAVATATDRVLHIFPAPGGTASAIPAGRIDAGGSIETDSEVITGVRVLAHSYTHDASGGIEVGGVKYKDTTTAYTASNPDAGLRDRTNVREISDETLVSPANGQTVANTLMAYYRKRRTYKGKITLDGEKLGDYVSLSTGWGETITGNIISLAISYGNAGKAEIEVLGI